MKKQIINANGSTERNGIIDTLRFLGLSLIILAHVNPNEYIFQLRNFDVPLMFIVMGMSFGLTSDKQRTKLTYIVSRFKRLIIPTWVFLVFMFVTSYLYYLTANIRIFYFSEYEIYTSFSLSRGFGFVWVIRLFFAVSVIAILTPSNFYRINVFIIYILSISIIFMSDNILGEWYKELDSGNDILLLGSFLSNVIPYFFIFLLGTKLLNATSKQMYSIFSISLLFFLGHALYNYLYHSAYYQTQIDKYPPGLYYLSYSLAMSLLCLIALRTLQSKNINTASALIIFISSNSIWIYLWHIVFVMLTDSVDMYFLARYALVYAAAILSFSVQYRLITQLSSKLHNKKYKNWMTSIFTG